MASAAQTVSIAEILGLGDQVRIQDPKILISQGGRFLIRPYVDKLVDGELKKVQERIYLKATSKRDAIREKNEIMATINHSKYVVQSQMNFGEFLDYYLKEYVHKPGNLAASTRSKYEGHIERHIRPAFAALAMAQVDTKRIDVWLGQKVRDGLSWSTRMDLRNILSGIFTQARKWGWWKEVNPALDVTVGRQRAAREHFKLTVDQTRLLLAELPADVCLICEVALYCGMRISEVLGLMWKHVDFKRGVLMIRQRWYRGDLDTVKTRKANRDVAMGELAGDLRGAAGKPEEFVFTVKTHVGKWKTPGTCRDDRDINQHFLRPAAVKLGFYRKGFGFHAFRREAITEHGRVLSMAQVQNMVGHAKADLTQAYTLKDAVQQQKAVRTLQRRIRGKELAKTA